MLSSTAMTTGRQPRKWTVAEDQKLLEEVEAQIVEGEVKDWCRIAAKLRGRTNKDCRKRWFNSVAGGLKKGQWSKSEDLQLRRGVEQYGTRWTLVASVVGSRSADQCAKRWQQSLDPGLDRSKWRDIEDRTLIEAVQHMGRHWKDIQRQHFPERSKNCIKNRYTVLVRRYQNQGITLPQPTHSPKPDDFALSDHWTGDEDDMSHTSSVHGDLPFPHTEVSTPETQHSWPLGAEAFPSWSSQEMFNVACTAPDPTQIQQSQISNPTHGPDWSWTTPSMVRPATMHLAAPQVYGQGLSPVPLAPHNAYGTVPIPALLNTNSTHFPGPSVPTLANPQRPSRAMTSSPYQDAQAVSRFLRRIHSMTMWQRTHPSFEALEARYETGRK